MTNPPTYFLSAARGAPKGTHWIACSDTGEIIAAVKDSEIERVLDALNARPA